MKKLFSLSEVIIHIVLFVLLWTNGIYKTVSKSVFGNYRGGGNVSFVNCSINSSTIDRPIPPVGWIFILLLIVSCIILLLEIFRTKTIKYSAIIPILMLIAFVAISAYVDCKSGGSYKYKGDIRRMHLEMGTLFYVEIALLLIDIALNISKRFIANSQTTNDVLNVLKPDKIENCSAVCNKSNADELKKYKDLLDGGIITQEEFDEKKKQLLGL